MKNELKVQRFTVKEPRPLHQQQKAFFIWRVDRFIAQSTLTGHDVLCFLVLKVQTSSVT